MAESNLSIYVSLIAIRFWEIIRFIYVLINVIFLSLFD
jgi:hypothetical protein